MDEAYFQRQWNRARSLEDEISQLHQDISAGLRKEVGLQRLRFINASLFVIRADIEALMNAYGIVPCRKN